MTKKYFEDHQKKFKIAEDISEVYRRKALFYKWLYEKTKLGWAKEKNEYYVTEAQKLLIGCLGVCIADIAILQKHVKDLGD